MMLVGYLAVFQFDMGLAGVQLALACALIFVNIAQLFIWYKIDWDELIKQALLQMKKDLLASKSDEP